MKRIIAIIFSIILCLGSGVVFTGCSSYDLVIWTFTDEVKTMVENYYTPLVAPNTKINVEVIPYNSIVTRLDNAIKTQTNLPDVVALEEKIIRKFVENDLLLPLTDMIGADTANMYPYTFETVRHTDNTVRGLAWQATPGAMYYRYSIAQQYFPDNCEPEDFQELVSDWAGVLSVARTLKEADDIRIFSSITAPSRVFYSQRENPWVVDGTLTIDESLYANSPDSMFEVFKALQVGTGTLAQQRPFINETTETESAWYSDMSSDNVFSYLLGSWGLHYDLKKNATSATNPNKTTAGDWRVVRGPGAYSDGGTWLTILNSSKNVNEAKKFIKYVTTDITFLRAWANATGDFMNHRELMAEIAEDYSEEFLGGQNHYEILCEVAEEISGNSISRYDSYMNASFNEWAINYAKGEDTRDSALQGFKDGVSGGYTEITVN